VEPGDAGFVPAFCEGEVGCDAAGGFVAEESLPLPCCAPADTSAATAKTSKHLPLMLLFYFDNTPIAHGEKNRPLKGEFE